MTVSFETGCSVVSDERWELVYRSLKLSRREAQVLSLVLQDRKEKAIAGELGIQPSTVHTYVERLHRKVGVSSRVELVVRAYREYYAVADHEVRQVASA